MALQTKEEYAALASDMTSATNAFADGSYGLCASLFSANAKRAIRGVRMLRVGTVTVNSFGEGDIATPFGGRDNSIQSGDQYTQFKSIWIDLADVADAGVN